MTNIHIPEIPASVAALIQRAEADCQLAFARVEAIERINTRRVIRAFQEYRVGARHFAPTTGYGYDDIGRDTLSKLFSFVFETEDALVRPQIASGTHALALCLYGVLRPGDEMLAAAGRPYDTLEEVIGIAGAPGNGSLRDFGIGYREVGMLPSGDIDISGVLSQLTPAVKLVLIQRSRGYDWRPSLSVAQIDAAIEAIHRVRPDVCVMVDNCYGEFTDEREPRADLLAGSLIKNPGGGLAPTGGYVAGKSAFVEKVACRLTSPGIGAEVGSYAGSYQPFYQGLFLAPHTVAQAVKSAILAARAFELLGFAVNPAWDAPRNDIIEAIRFDDPEKLIAFCQAIQMCSPVDAEAVPEPWDMPGYQDPVIMAAGTFVSGASIELSADAPIRAPYIGYLQGALTYAHGRLGIEGAIAMLVQKGLVEL
ncbi:MAG TPA: methionine gamma-lyase family protein [Candidatus Pullichristensenella stercorigallinarum]|uniref:Methionine gamma-lyase family protein n=1 Tax=Candidatus Pullichristensenella stercorigallinarum TaxID=2840909 RepID=A0A9D0ZMI7_9FIRM|nr:methionine gamma-lyase family protein [Candidatus Pullichristensenella stercorigallinarum]